MKNYRTVSQKSRTMLISILIVFCIVMAAIVFFMFSTEVEWFFEKECENKISGISNHLSEFIEYYNDASINTFLKMKADSNKELNYLQFTYDDVQKNNIILGEKGKEPFLEYEKEITVNQEKIGSIIIQYDKSIVVKKKFQFITVIILGCVIFIFFILIFLKKFLNRIIEKPIRNLIQNINDVTTGNLEIDMHYESNDEIGKLSDSFKKMTDELRMKDDYSSSILNSTQAGVILIDTSSHKIEYANPVAIRMIGTDEENIIGKACHKFICTAQKGECPISDKGLSIDNSEDVLITASGKELPILKTVKNIEIGNKKLLIETFIDISEMKELQHQIVENESKYRTMFQASPSIIILTDAEGRLLKVNDRVAEWLGYDTESLIGKKDVELPFMTQKSIEKITSENKERAAGKDSSSYELEFVANDGVIHIGSLLVNAIKDEEDNNIGGVIIITDITKDVETKKYIKHQELIYRSMFDSVSEAIYVLKDKKFVDCNNASIKLFKMKSKKAFLKTDPKTISPQKQPGGLNSFDASVIELGKTIKSGFNKFEWMFRTKNGKEFPADVRTTLIKADDDEFIHVSVRDITSRKLAEKEIEKTNAEIRKNNWLKTGHNNLNELMSGEKNVVDLSRAIITYLAKYINAQIGALYLIEEDTDEMMLTGSYAFSNRKNLNAKIKIGEGLVGQAAFEKEMITLSNIPDDYIRINSSLGDAVPKNLIVTPFIFEQNVLGVIELGSIQEFLAVDIEFIQSAMKKIAIAINSAASRVKLKSLLSTTQKQAQQLQAQQEELRAANEELEEQTEELKASTEKLKTQQEELQASNEELEEKTDSLERQRVKVIRQNDELGKAQVEIEKKAEDLAISSKYKSEFLANMSHELRTPLNSLLILSRDLASNKKGNLDDKQVKSAEIVYNSGNDLLNLINEILDLSKVEAGKMSLSIQDIHLREIAVSIEKTFKHQTDIKKLKLNIIMADSIPQVLKTDGQRVQQVLRNLLSNAIKFTMEGDITVNFDRPKKGTDLSLSGLDPKNSIAISVEDTGIGIPEDKQVAIFEAFQQVDGSTSRKYGGTGLGLSISRELAKLLGGELQMSSVLSQGSTFTIFLPEAISEKKFEKIHERRKSPDRRSKREITIPDKIKKIVTSPIIEDDRENISKEDRTILVIEDDLNFAETLHDFCKEKNFKFLHAGSGEIGINLAKKYIPDAIILDVKLPGMDGWYVLQALKESPDLRHIPVHMMSVEEDTINAVKKGAVGYLNKPVKIEQLEDAFDKMETFYTKGIKKLLLVEDNEVQQKHLLELLEEDGLKVSVATSGKSALKELKTKKYDCIILDLFLPDIYGYDLLKKFEAEGLSVPPVIIYSANKDITPEEEFKLRKYTDSIIIKSVKSEERLLDETALFLHQVVGKMPKKKRDIIKKLHDKDAIFQKRRIFLVDDDMRNVFAISHILEEKGMEVISAINGKKAVDILKKDSNFDLVLMDIMMPEMDGYEAMKQIRSKLRLNDLPIIALTAKAMKEDKVKCLAAGANDYLSKPVETDRLLSLMRVWLYK